MSPSSRRRSMFIGALDCAIAIVVNARADPHFVFASHQVDGIVLAIAFLMPLIMAICGVPIGYRPLRLVVSTLLCLVAGLGTLTAAAIGVGTILSADPPPTMMSVGRHTLAVFEYDGFFSTDVGAVSVEQVCTVLPGVMFVRQLRRDQGLEMPQIDVVGPDRVQINGERFDLPPLIWPLC